MLLCAATALAASGAAQAACPPTLGTGDCPRFDYLWIQPLEHHYLDAPMWREPSPRHTHRSPKKAAAGAK
jgi:hypothetical protein